MSALLHFRNKYTVKSQKSIKMCVLVYVIKEMGWLSPVKLGQNKKCFIYNN